MRIRRKLVVAVVAGFSLLTNTPCIVTAQPEPHASEADNLKQTLASTGVRPLPALEALVQLFDRYQVVGLSDLHGCAELLSFVEQLVQSHEFLQRVNDITFEPGNVRFQPLMDDFILRGKDVPLEDLRRVWRENTQAHTYSDTPALLQLLRSIRQVNLTLPEERRLRVLLIDPAVNWNEIQSRADIQRQDFDRESHMAEVLEREVYAKGRKALFFAGGIHLSRGSQPHIEAFPTGPLDGLPPATARQDRPGRLSDQPQADGILRGARSTPRTKPLQALVSPLQALENRHPGTTYAIGIYEGFGERTGELEQILASWPRPVLVAIRNTWWGELPLPPSGDILVGPDGKRVMPPADRTIQDNWDASLFLGLRSELSRVAPPGTDVLDADWLRELKRRQNILGRPPRQDGPSASDGRFFPDIRSSDRLAR